MSNLIDVVQRFRGLRALVVGDVMLDRYLEGTASRLCSEGPVPIVRKTGERVFPGGAGNAAANLRSLGADVALLGLIGRDAAGERLQSALAEFGVDDRWLVADERCETHTKLRIQADGHYVVRFDQGDTQRPSAERRQTLLANLERVAATCDVIVISDYGYGVVGDDVMQRISAIRDEHDAPLVIDSKYLGRFRGTGATIVTPNHLEAKLTISPNANSDGPVSISEAAELGRRILEMVEAESAAITMAGDGVMLVTRSGEATHLDANTVTYVSDVGAGDSFAAALALALAAGSEHREATRLGIDAATIAICKPGTAVVHHQELLRRVSLRSIEVDAPGAIDRTRSLADQLDVERLNGARIVFTNGVFDILHAGHVDFLRRAKELGDILVVGVNSDRSTRSLKGAQRPVNSEQDRVALVSALESVDHALLFDEAEPSTLIRLLRPHLHVKGGDFEGQDLPEAAAVSEVGGQIQILPLAGDLSSSQVIDRIIAMSTAAGDRP